MNTLCVTFGQQYRNKVHPVDARAHPDGWFEFEAEVPTKALTAAQQYLMGDDGCGNRMPLYAFHYDEHDLQRGYYPRGCLARFRATPSDDVVEMS